MKTMSRLSAAERRQQNVGSRTSAAERRQQLEVNGRACRRCDLNKRRYWGGGESTDGAAVWGGGG